MSLVRMTGMPYFLTETTVRNQYVVRVINKSAEPRTFTIEHAIENQDQNYEIKGIDDAIYVEGISEEMRSIALLVPKESYNGHFPVKFSLIGSDGRTIMTREAEFIGPDARLLKQKELESNGSTN